MTVDPQQIIAEGVKAAARQDRRHSLILGLVMLAAGVAFGVLGILGVTHAIDFDQVELVFGLFGLALSMLVGGLVKLARAFG